ncbi:HIT family protein [Bacillus sp. m3-13]|uniref:HIT family protein n=1 Tax=Bacillus sp. m3-13 TaxID=406124 RepID=UPI001F1AA680|nr:HIT domain-containing protein [Bacillus sp. m3-13]
MITKGSLESQILGYLYLEPKRHVENWTDFTSEELLELGPLIKKVEVAMQNELEVERLYVVTISEAVRHLHLHLIPREYKCESRGLDLIKQATQQEIITPIKYDSEKINLFYSNLKNLFLQ